MSAPPQFVDTLPQFLEIHPRQFLDTGGDRWEFLESGQGNNTVVIVGGGGSTAQSMLPVNAALSSHAHVISIGMPAKALSLDDVVRGIETILDSQGVNQAVFLGHSLGGMVVQYFALCRPHRVAGLVLSGAAFYLGVRSYLRPFVCRSMALAPEAMLIRLVKSQMSRLLGSVPDSQFWISFYSDELDQPEAGARFKYQFQLLAECAIFFRRHPIAGAAPELTSIPVEIISAEDDRGFTKREVASLASSYKMARTVILPKGTGHLSFLTRHDEYIRIVEQFLQDLAPPASSPQP
jgi:pimeloyl-ACP methyl ester carboxylesterase